MNLGIGCWVLGIEYDGRKGERLEVRCRMSRKDGDQKVELQDGRPDGMFG